MNEVYRNYIVIMIVAISTYLMRFLPIKFKEKLRFGKFEDLLTVSSTSIISALFTISFISSIKNSYDLFTGIVTLTTVFFFQKLLKNLGLSILIGVLVYFLLSFILSNL